MPIISKEKDHLHKSPSVVKLLGKKIFSKEDDNTIVLGSASGTSITPVRKRPNSPLHGNNKSASSSSQMLNSSNVKSKTRHRSPSLLSKKTSSFDNTNIHHVKSVADLTSHNVNPFITEKLNNENNESIIEDRKKPGTPKGNNIFPILNKRATSGDLHRANSTNTKKKVGAAHTHHLAARSRSKSFIPHNENIIYNPYGINSRSGTAFGNDNISNTANNNEDLSFYLHDGNTKVRMLPLPIEDPNKYLPEEMKEYSIHLTDNFVFDTDNKPIGSGGSSEVRKIKSSYRQKDVYALKKLNMIYDETPEKFYKRCSKEFIIAKYLSHNIHIMPTFLLLKVPTTTYTTRGWGFVMELGVKDLFDLIERTGWKTVPIQEKFCIFKQIAQGVKFCHDNGIAHRDLKPENVLITKDGICKLTDFGISDWYHKEPHNFESPIKMCEGMIGSPPFTPPEVMYWDAKKHYPEKYQKPYNPLEMDCYALGIILFTLVNSVIPFIESCNSDARFREFEVSYENYVVHQNPHFRDRYHYKAGPGSEYSLARNFKTTEGTRVAWRLSDPNPNTRYTMDELINDPWFKAIETCVNPDDETYNIKYPEIRHSSTNEIENSNNTVSDSVSVKSSSSSTQVVQHTSNPFSPLKNTSNNNSTLTSSNAPTPLSNTNSNSSMSGGTLTATNGTMTPPAKPRSMVDIATSPNRTLKRIPISRGEISRARLPIPQRKKIEEEEEEEETEENKRKWKKDKESTASGSTIANTTIQESQSHESDGSDGEGEFFHDAMNTVDSLMDQPTPNSTEMMEPPAASSSCTKEIIDAPTRGTPSASTEKLVSGTPPSREMSKLSLSSGTKATSANRNVNNSTTSRSSSNNDYASGLLSSSSSIRSGSTAATTSTARRKLVVHHHLDVPSSVTAGTSRTLMALMSGQ